MKITASHFCLPEHLIAKYPLENRDNDRMMVVHRATGKIEHKHFKNFLDYLEPGDAVVANDSKTSPWLLYANKDRIDSKIDVTLLRELDKVNHIWDVIVDPARKIRVSNKLSFGEKEDLVAEVLDNTTSRGRTIKFSFKGHNDELKELIHSLGNMPIPPMLSRESEHSDLQNYQCVYSQTEGGVVTPAAGLRFSDSILKRLELNDIKFLTITLHISVSSLYEIEVEDVSKYRTDSEHLIIKEDVCSTMNNTIKKGKKICIIGTSTLRAIESSIAISGLVIPTDEWSNIFIYSPNQVTISNMLLTNFHLPRTIPLITTSAVLGSSELFQDVYQEAIKEEYRFFIYGDCLLIL